MCIMKKNKNIGLYFLRFAAAGRKRAKENKEFLPAKTKTKNEKQRWPARKRC